MKTPVRRIKKPSFFIGRYQPLHKGHIAMFRKVLAEGKPIVVGLRRTPYSRDNPYSYAKRKQMFKDVFQEEIASGRMQIMALPDIAEVCHGRKVGWGIREIHLDPETEAISGTEIRKGTKE